VRTIQFLCGDRPTGETMDGRVVSAAFHHENPWQFYVLENAGRPSNVFTACTSGINCDLRRFAPMIGSLKLFNFQMAMNWTLPESSNPFLLFLWSVYLSLLNFCVNTRNPKSAMSDSRTLNFAVMVYGNLKTFGLFLWFLRLKAREFDMDTGFADNLEKVLNMDPSAVMEDAFKKCIATALNLQIVEFVLREDFAVSKESNRLLVKVKAVHTTQRTYIYDHSYASEFFTCDGEPDLVALSKDYTKVRPVIWHHIPLPYFDSRAFPVSKRTTFYEAIAFNLEGDDLELKVQTVIQFLKESVRDLLNIVYFRNDDATHKEKTFSSDQKYGEWDSD
jgi:hypothetical protein